MLLNARVALRQQIVVGLHAASRRRRSRFAPIVVDLATSISSAGTRSLRGLHASVATDAGATAHVVAAALGRTSPEVTQAHYIDQGTAARTRRVLERLDPRAKPVRRG